MPRHESTVATDQHTLFGEPLPPAPPAPRPRVAAVPPDSANLTPVGATQAAYRTARDAVRQEAVAMGSADRFDWRTQRRLSPRERDALGTNHPEMFTVVPGSQTVKPKIVDVFRGFYEQYEQWYGRATASFSGISDYSAKQFARAANVTIVPTDPHAASGASPSGASPSGAAASGAAASGAAASAPIRLVVERGGHLFSATGTYLPDVLAALARKVKGGLAQADGPAPRQAKAEKSALEAMWEKMGPEMQAKRQAYFHFQARARLYHNRREQGIPFALSDNDWEIAARIGIPRADEETVAELGANGVTQALLNEVAKRTRIVEDVMDEGVSKTLLPGESMQRVTDEVGFRERQVNDRYFGKRDNPTSVAE